MLVRMIKAGSIQITKSLSQTYPAKWTGDVDDEVATKWIKEGLAEALIEAAPETETEPTAPPKPKAPAKPKADTGTAA